MLVFLCKPASLFAHIEQLFFLQGKLGEKNIAMRIQREDNIYHGEYFFLNEKKNILFKGPCEGKDCTLNVFTLNKATNKEEVTESFAISENSEHNWTGIWKKGDNSAQIILRPIDVKTITHKFADIPFIKKVDPFSYVRTADLTFTQVKTKKINGLTVVWLKENFSGVEFFRIKKGLAEPALTELNGALTSIHLNNVEGYFWCNSAFVEATYKFGHSISFLNKKLLNINTTLVSDCHGTGAEAVADNLTLDCENGKTLALENIFYVGNDAIPEVNSGEWFTYRYNVFGAFIFKTLAELYPDKFKAQDKQCNYNKVEAWQFPQWRISDKGLVLKPYFPDYLHCEIKEEFLIPFAKLETYRKKDF